MLDSQNTIMKRVHSLIGSSTLPVDATVHKRCKLSSTSSSNCSVPKSQPRLSGEDVSPHPTASPINTNATRTQQAQIESRNTHSRQQRSRSTGKSVRFLGQVAIHEIPCRSELDKGQIYYSAADYRRFSSQETVRREALQLTIVMCREQERRLRRGTDPITTITAQILYDRILHQEVDAARPCSRNLQYLPPTRNGIVAQCA